MLEPPVAALLAPLQKGGSDNGFYGVDDGLGLDEHSGSSSVDLVVDLLVFIGAECSWVDKGKSDQIFCLSFLQKGGGEEGVEDFREEGDDVDVHDEDTVKNKKYSCYQHMYLYTFFKV